MSPDPKGIFDVIGGWFDNEANNAVNDAEKTGFSGPTKKLNVISLLLDILGIGGWVGKLIEKLLGSFIDGIVSEKNTSGEFKHNN